MFRQECQKLNADAKKGERKSSTNNLLIKKAKEMDFEACTSLLVTSLYDIRLYFIARN